MASYSNIFAVKSITYIQDMIYLFYTVFIVAFSIVFTGVFYGVFSTSEKMDKRSMVMLNISIGAIMTVLIILFDRL